VLEQPIVTLIELVNVGDPAVRAKQVAKGAALEPQSIKAPLCARRKKNEQNVVPARSLAARRQALAPEVRDDPRGHTVELTGDIVKLLGSPPTQTDKEFPAQSKVGWWEY
jgi:hypothetical protein